MTTKNEEDGTYRDSVDAVLNDMRAVVRDVDALLHATQDQAGEKFADVRARVQESLGHAKERLESAGTGVRDRARSAGKATDSYVHENPWTAVAIAVGLGYLIGRIGRRD